MISRQWTGLANKGRAGEYIFHLQQETFPALSSIPGFLKAAILKRPVAEGTEFLVVTEWASLEAIKQFAGADPETAVVPPLVQDIMIRYDKVVKHYEMV